MTVWKWNQIFPVLSQFYWFHASLPLFWFCYDHSLVSLQNNPSKTKQIFSKVSAPITTMIIHCHGQSQPTTLPHRLIWWIRLLCCNYLWQHLKAFEPTHFTFISCLKAWVYSACSCAYQVCPDADGKRHVNLLCPVDVSTQPEGSLPDIQSSEHAVDMLKEFQADSSEQVGLRFTSPWCNISVVI